MTRAATALLTAATLVALALAITPLREGSDVWFPCNPTLAEQTSAVFIRPGSMYLRGKPQDGPLPGQEECVVDPGSGCNVGFLLRLGEGSGAPYYATTAGHCLRVNKTGGSNGRPLYVMHPTYGAWGKLVYTAPGNVPPLTGHDIALVEIFPGYQDNVDPSIPYFGGPTGIVQPGEEPAGGAFVAHVGRGVASVAAADVTVPRVGSLIGMNASEWRCVCVSFHGDSGSPFLSHVDGKAIGVLHGGYPDYNVTSPTRPRVDPTQPCASDPGVTCSPDPAHPYYKYGHPFWYELHHLQSVTRDGHGNAVDWTGLRLATAPLADVW